MKVLIIGTLSVINILHLSNGLLRNIYSKRLKSTANLESSDEPLILTPYLEQNKIDEARRLSEVHINGFDTLKSYSGYFTVNKPFNSNHFFWFFPAEHNVAHAPVLIWLNGGPGDPSLIGLFLESGPFELLNETHAQIREERWTKNHSIIYIDNPVGTGYSFTNSGYCENETQVGKELYNSIQQFYQLFPDLRNNEFYIAGESYAGKYIPALAHTIHQLNSDANLKMNLKGLMIGNGLIDPVNQLTYDEFLYQVGLIDDVERGIARRKIRIMTQLIRGEMWEEAVASMEDLFLYLLDILGSTHLYNILEPYSSHVTSKDFLQHFIQMNVTRNAIHVGNQNFIDDIIVMEHLRSDFMKSVVPWLTEALDNYKVLIYNGQLDITVPYSATENFLKTLNFQAAEEYKNATRQKWYVENDLAGYVKQAGNLQEVLVLHAGHMVPFDQPKRARDLITRFTHHQSLTHN